MRRMYSTTLHSTQIPNVIGRIHSKDFTAIDGHGVRYLLFLAGCCLKCNFCANPDTWDISKGQPQYSKDIFEDIMKYKPYIEGLTCSGGDPLLQPHFVSSLFRMCHREGLSTCLDTAGQCKRTNWEIVLPFTDYVLFCMKHPDPDKYKELTGISQKHAIEFLSKLEEYKIPFSLRYLLIPGHTDNPGDLDKLQGLIKDHSTLKKIELLPYHELGLEKWKELGLQPKRYRVPTKDEVAIFREQIIGMGHKVL
jgi:pyruvate formate lyase activating enzyme